MLKLYTDDDDDDDNKSDFNNIEDTPLCSEYSHRTYE